jgi:hypothetical protein
MCFISDEDRQTDASRLSETQTDRHYYPYVLSLLANISVGIAMGWTTRVRIPAGAINLSLLHSVQTDSGAHPASYPMGTRGSFPRVVKRPGLEADHSPLSSAEIKNSGAIPPLPHASL